MNLKTQSAALDGVRREIDAVDDGLIELLARRAQLSEQVKALKQASGGAGGSPLRPAREAALFDRLLTKGTAAGVTPELLVRLWRGIICDSSLRQAAITLYVPENLAASVPIRLTLAEAFPLMPFAAVASEADALSAVAARAADCCVVAAEGDWLKPYLAGQAGAARISALIIAADESGNRRLLLLAQTAGEPSRHDETLVATRGSLPRDFPLKPNWQVRNGEAQLSALPGFLSEKDNPLMGLIRANPGLGLKVLGRYPAPRE